MDMAELATILSMMVLFVDLLAVGKVWSDWIGLVYIWNLVIDYLLDLYHTLYWSIPWVSFASQGYDIDLAGLLFTVSLFVVEVDGNYKFFALLLCTT